MKINVNKDVIDRLHKTIREVGSNIDAVLATNVLQIYKNAQARRFQTANASESDGDGAKPWKPLDRVYEARKRRQARQSKGTFMGGGKVIGIRTGRLFNAATLTKNDENDTSVITKGRSLFITITIPYAGFFDAERTISHFGKGTRGKWADQIKNYILKQTKARA